MPVKHDLYQDLGVAKDEVEVLKHKDPHLAALIAKYTLADQKVVEAEANNAIGVSDETLNKLKENRLKVKDEVAKRVKKSL